MFSKFLSLSKFVVQILVMGAVLAIPLTTNAFGEALSTEEAAKRAGKLYRLLNNGLPLLLDNPLYGQIVDAVKVGNVKTAAEIITNPRMGSASFYNVAIASLSQSMNRQGTAVGARNEIGAMFVGYARDGLKFSEAFWADRVYFDPTIQGTGTRYAISNPNAANHFNEVWIAQNPRDALKANPRPVSPAVGIFTSAQWGASYFEAGTNRRNWGAGIMEDLYCTKQDKIRSLIIPDTYVGRDVPRAPGGDPVQYLKTCKGCHAQMDALRPAFLAYDYINGAVQKFSPIREKINENNFDTYQPTSDDWHLFVTSEQNSIFGFMEVGGLTFENYGPDVKVMNGKGLDQFGKVIGGSRGLYRCMIRRIVSQVYLGKVFGMNILDEAEVGLLDSQNEVIERFAGEFHKHQNLRKAYEDVALYYLEAIQE